MPTTRSSAKKKARESSDHAAGETSATDDLSPRYRTRSLTRSHSDPFVATASSPLRFPLFDEFNTSTCSTQNYDNFFSPGKMETPIRPELNNTRWETDLSPIAKSPNSDGSQEMLDVPALDASPPTHSVTSAETEAVLDNEKGMPPRSKPQSECTDENSLAPPLRGEQEGPSASTISDLSSARKKLGQSSNAFIERIRTAAHRRKMAMTRSRVSLAAKEQQQKLRSRTEDETEAAEEVTAGVERSKRDRDSLWTASTTVTAPFRARPLPATTGALGSGGLDGVPKVDKRPATTPFSPLLGARRGRKTKIKALAAPKPLKKTDDPKPKDSERQRNPLEEKSDEMMRPFQAREVPPSVRSAENGGQFGIPKVSKRPITVAMSPLLGARRRTRSADARSKTRTLIPQLGSSSEERNSIFPAKQSSVNSARTTVSNLSHRSPPSTDSSLLGLDLLGMPKLTHEGNEENITPRGAHIKAYEPHSTRRAKKRAEFDTRRKTMFQLRTERQMQEREQDIRTIQRELNRLRYEL